MKDHYIIDWYDPIERVSVQVSGKELKQYIKSKEIVEDSKPDMSWTKKKIEEWMDKNGIEFKEDDTKRELLDKIGE